MRAVLAGRRTPGDEGAIAILVSLVFLFVLLPAAALGLTSYARGGVRAEKARSADSGALTGAAALTLVNLGLLPPISNLQVPPNSAVLALTRACTAAAKAAAVDNTLSKAFAGPPASGTPGCVPFYTPETAFGPCVDVITSALPRLDPITLPDIIVPGVPAVTVPDPLGGPPIIVTPAIPQTVIPGGTTDVSSIYSIVRNLIPGLLHNGVSVTINYEVSGPLDAILHQTGQQPSSVTSTARRRFKALLPDLSALAGLPALSPQQAQVVAALQVLIETLKGVVGQEVDVSEVVDTLNQLIPGSPVPPIAPVRVLDGACRDAAQSVLDDLSDALKTNPDPSQDLLACLQQVVLGLDPQTNLPDPTGASITVDPNCTEKVFRAELTS